jgi:hypothetical protein
MSMKLLAVGAGEISEGASDDRYSSKAGPYLDHHRTEVAEVQQFCFSQLPHQRTSAGTEWLEGALEHWRTASADSSTGLAPLLIAPLAGSCITRWLGSGGVCKRTDIEERTGGYPGRLCWSLRARGWVAGTYASCRVSGWQLPCEASIDGSVWMLSSAYAARTTLLATPATSLASPACPGPVIDCSSLTLYHASGRHVHYRLATRARLRSTLLCPGRSFPAYNPLTLLEHLRIPQQKPMRKEKGVCGETQVCNAVGRHMVKALS